MTAEPSCGLIGTNGLFREPVSTRPRTPSRRCAPRNADIGWPVGGTLTGRGGDIIIIDDPIKPQDAQSKSVREKTVQWYENTLLSRLDDKVHGAIVVVMQRLHLDDLSAHLLERGGFEHLCLPAIAEGKQTIQLDYGRTYVRSPGDVLDPVREPLSALGTLQVWAEPFVKLRLPKLFNLRTDPFERADVTSNTYYDWFLHRDYIIFAAQFIARQFAPTFKEFPPAQKAASFTIDDALDKMNDAVGGAGH
jgi:hypothetical protein